MCFYKYVKVLCNIVIGVENLLYIYRYVYVGIQLLGKG